MLHLCGAPDDAKVLAAPLSWRGRSLDAFAPQAWVAGSDRRFLQAVVGGSGVLRFRRIRLIDDPLSAFDSAPLHSRLDGVGAGHGDLERDGDGGDDAALPETTDRTD